LTKIVSPVTDLGHITLLQWRSEPLAGSNFQGLPSVWCACHNLAWRMLMKVATAEGSELE
jgi:hypothetical protein